MKKSFLRTKLRSFTLVELIVTIAIMALLAVVSFAMLPVYQKKANVDQAAQETEDLLLKVQNLAMSPEGASAGHYVLFLNTNQTERHTPYFMALAYYEDHTKNCCQSLEPNGGYCIAKEALSSGSIEPTFGIEVDPESTSEYRISGPRERYCVGTQGKLNVDRIIIDESLLSTTERHGDCPGDYSDSRCAGSSNCIACETGMFKLHFRTHDGQVGLNGSYYDVNPTNWTGMGSPQKAIFEVVKNGESKTLYINLYTGAIYIE